jgi:hypothetical protein
MASGKTYLANHLVETQFYQKLAFADKLKGIAYELFGVQSKDGNGRVVLQQIGDAMRAIDEDVWVKYTLSKIKMMHQGVYSYPVRYVIDDLRLENEARWLKKNGFVLIRVEADENVRVARRSTLYPNSPSTALLHASEREYEGIVADYVITNNNFMSLIHLDELLNA